MCNSFLWSGSPNLHHKTKVSWDNVCHPESEGGLGIRRLVDTSWVFGYSLIWRVLTSHGSLWVKWVHHHLIREHSFWDTPTTMLGSWVWRKLLKLRSSVFEFIKGTLRAGTTLSFWHDTWINDEPLIKMIGPMGHGLFGIAQNSSVAAATEGETWHIRNCVGRFRDIAQKILRTPTPKTSAESDFFTWRHSPNVYKDFFLSSRTWDQIRSRGIKVPWDHVVCFPQAIPRSSFITWLAVLNRLST